MVDFNNALNQQANQITLDTETYSLYSFDGGVPWPLDRAELGRQGKLN